MAELARNREMATSIAAFARSGKPVYAECGGLMYLARTLTWGDRVQPMCGVLPIDVEMRERPQGRGSMQLEETGLAPWGRFAETGARVPAHEFHYSCITSASDVDLEFAYDVKRGFGADGARDGIVYGNVMASYAHLRNTRRSPWIKALLCWMQQTTRSVEVSNV